MHRGPRLSPAVRAGGLGGHYMPSQNLVTVSAALPAVVCTSKRTDAFVLGALGGVIAHEIAHSLDTRNWGFYETGYASGNGPRYGLRRIVDRLVENASRDVRNGLIPHFSPAECKNELLADYLSLSAGLRALSDGGARLQDVRDFFLGWSSLWDTTGAARAIPYPPDLYRIMLVRNFDQFYYAFKCDSSSSMCVPSKDRVRL
ncbi:M13-type metalloendopeptidase [Streptomyces canus]|uniref:M13-type metalloendopeptidase n=1 Tax=Streptomyces canus TaxID=58343 RepID=UPI0033B31E83